MSRKIFLTIMLIIIVCLASLTILGARCRPSNPVLSDGWRAPMIAGEPKAASIVFDLLNFIEIWMGIALSF